MTTCLLMMMMMISSLLSSQVEALTVGSYIAGHTIGDLFSTAGLLDMLKQTGKITGSLSLESQSGRPRLLQTLSVYVWVLSFPRWARFTTSTLAALRVNTKIRHRDWAVKAGQTDRQTDKYTDRYSLAAATVSQTMLHISSGSMLFWLICMLRSWKSY